MAAAVVAVGAALAGKVAASAVSGAILSLVVGSLAAGAVSFVGAALLGGPDMPDYSASDFNDTGGGRTQMVRQPVSHWQIAYGRVKASGPMVFIHANGDKNKNLYLIIPIAGHEIDGIEELYLSDELVELNEDGQATNSRWIKDGVVCVYADFHLGGDNQIANQRFVDETDGQWTIDHRLRGHAYIALKLVYDEKVFAGGIPNPTVVFRGKKVLDPRNESVAWTENAALCIRDYLVTERNLGGYGVVADRMNEASFMASANVADEPVTLKGEGTEPRYTCNGILDTSRKPSRLIDELLSTCIGTLDLAGGKWSLRVAQAYVSTDIIDEDWLRGPIDFSPKRARTELFNAIKGTFICSEQKYQPTDYPQVKSDIYADQDGGETIYVEHNLPFTNRPATAQRTMKILLERHRLQKTIKLPCNLKAVDADPGKVYTLNLPNIGLTGASFRVVQWELDDEWMGVNLTLEEDSASAYAWDSAVDELDMPIAPEVVAPDQMDNTPPDMVSGLSAAATTGQITLSWTCPDDEDFLRCKVYRHTLDDWSAAAYRGAIYDLPGNHCGWLDQEVEVGTEFFYWVRTEDGNENLSNYGTAVSAVSV